MKLNRKTRNRATRLARAATILTAGALSLGAVHAEPFSSQQFVAKAQSLDPGPIAASDSVIVEQEVVQETPTFTPVRRSGGGGGCGLDRIKRKESGGNYGAVSGSGKYRGAYQFDQRTWESTGGSGDPATASPSEQDSRAAALYARRGSAPWNC
jgi:transglycosylase-like protein